MILIDAMEDHKVKAGQHVIKQGDKVNTTLPPSRPGQFSSAPPPAPPPLPLLLPPLLPVPPALRVLQGSHLYFIDSGELEACTEVNGVPSHLHSLAVGQTFGELALMWATSSPLPFLILTLTAASCLPSSLPRLGHSYRLTAASSLPPSPCTTPPLPPPPAFLCLVHPLHLLSSFSRLLPLPS